MHGYMLVSVVSVARPRGGGGVEPPPLLASRTTPGIRTKPQRNFFGKGVGVPSILLQPTSNIDSLTRSKEVSSKSSTNTIDGGRAIP
jgi:hypothetical protein